METRARLESITTALKHRLDNGNGTPTMSAAYCIACRALATYDDALRALRIAESDAEMAAIVAEAVKHTR